MIDRPKEPPKFDDDFDDDEFPNERPTTPGGESMPEERPTVSPPFDVEEYAKSSDSKVRTMKTPSPRHADASTKPPPAPVPDLDLDLDIELPEAAPALPKPDRARPPQITLTDEYETEEARLRSIALHSDPPPHRTSGTSPVSLPRIEREDSSPATVAYPAEYERDPFAHLNQPSSSGSRAARPATNDMSDRFSLGDYTGALELAEAILARDPANVDALQCADESRAKLVQMYTARIGPLDRVPMVVVAREQLRWLSIDHRAGFLLSHIDGVSSLEMILDVSGMPLLDALKILCELSQQKVITFR